VLEAPVAAPEVPSEAAVPGLVFPSLPQRTAKSPVPIASTPDLERLLIELGTVVDAHAKDPQNPWAIAHGLLARGPEFQLVDGRSAVDFLFTEYAVETSASEKRLVDFPRSVQKEGRTIDVEPHTDLLLKVLTEIGVRLDHEVEVQGSQHQLGELWQRSVESTWLDLKSGESSFDSPNDMPWGMQGIATYAGDGFSWESEGRTMSMDDLANLMVHVLTEESRELLIGMKTGQGFQKRGQGVFGYTCGGAHLLQGAAYVVARGFGDQAARDKMELQGYLASYRLPLELQIYADLLERAPEHKLVLMAQQLKFTGHWLESVHKMAAMGLYKPSAKDQEVMALAVGSLLESVLALKSLGALDNLEAIQKQNPQLYLDLVGDSAHAIHGLELALGRVSVSY